MVAQGNLVASQLNGGVVQNATPQARAQSAGGVSLRHIGLHDGVSVLLDDAKVLAKFGEVSWQDLGRESRLLLVQIDSDELKTHGCPGLQVAQQRQQRVAIFAAAETNHDSVAI